MERPDERCCMFLWARVKDRKKKSQLIKILLLLLFTLIFTV